MGVRAIIATCCAVLSVALSTAPAQAAFPGQNGKIAFSRSTVDCMYTINPDGSNETPTLPCDQDPEGRPRWSPDGQQIAFLPAPQDWATTELGIVNADGSNLRRFFYDSGVPITGHGWSPDGARLIISTYFCGVELCRWALLQVDAATGADLSDTGGLEFNTAGGVDWSPDGELIAFGRDSQIYTVGSDLTNLAPVAPDSPVINTNPAWSPSSNRIAFESTRDGNREIYVMNADGTAQTRLTTNGADDGSPRWSPDGSKIVFHSNRDGNYEIYVMNADGTGQTRLTNNSLDDKHPDWQPIPINSYPRPKGATPTQVALVPAYAQCTSPNRTHGPPLAFPSCASPAQTSDELTVGTADSNGKAAKARGLVRYDVLPGAPATPADEADVQIRVELSDVYEQGTLTDYAGELRSRTSLRITDKLNTPHPGGPGAATVSDATLGATVPCTATADITEGASCNLVTTFDSLVPGTVTETKRSIWALGAAQLDDGGADNDADTPGDNTLFMTQGIFIP